MFKEKSTPKVWLMIDTSLEMHYFALWQEGLLWEFELPMKLSMEQSMEKLAKYLENSPSISAVMLATGPGSYTGLRWGYSLGCGLAASLKVPLIAFSSFVAYSSAEAKSLVLFDARAGGLYVALLDQRGALLSDPLRWSKTWDESHWDFLGEHKVDVLWQSPEAETLKPLLSQWPIFKQTAWNPSRWIEAWKNGLGQEDQFPFRTIRLEYLKQDSDVPSIKKTET